VRAGGGNFGLSLETAGRHAMRRMYSRAENLTRQRITDLGIYLD
jgi:hypothetical protein